MPLSDIDIAQAAPLVPVMQMARDRLGIPGEALEPYGHFKAKIDLGWLDRHPGPLGKLILVTAISPTPAWWPPAQTRAGFARAWARH